MRIGATFFTYPACQHCGFPCSHRRPSLHAGVPPGGQPHQGRLAGLRAAFLLQVRAAAAAGARAEAEAGCRWLEALTGSMDGKHSLSLSLLTTTVCLRCHSPHGRRHGLLLRRPPGCMGPMPLALRMQGRGDGACTALPQWTQKSWRQGSYSPGTPPTHGPLLTPLSLTARCPPPPARLPVQVQGGVPVLHLLLHAGGRGAADSGGRAVGARLVVPQVRWGKRGSGSRYQSAARPWLGASGTTTA